MFERHRAKMMIWAFLLLLATTLTDTQLVSTETKSARTKPNVFDPVLSANAYIGRIKENERVVLLEPRLYASDADAGNTANGKICGYELSLHKHDDILDEITRDIPFLVELVDNQAVVKLKPQLNTLDCEVTSTYRLFVRAFDCASASKRRYSERSALTITVEDVNEYAPVFTHNQYLFKLHQDQTCESSSCRVEATDDDCNNRDHRVCGYEIITPNVPFTIDNNGSISITKALTNNQYDFDVIARDCYPSSDRSKQTSQPARVTFKIIPSCSPSLNDKAPKQLGVQSDRIRLFDTIDVNACEETCQVEDIVGTVMLDAHGLDSGCDLQQCSTVNREYVLLPKEANGNGIPKSQIRSFDGYAQSTIVNKTDFSGHFNDEFIIRMWMKHANDVENNDKHHVFCKSDEKLKNRHHTALFVQNNQLKLLLRKGPLTTNDKTAYESEWIWKLAQINDDQWHSYKFVVSYPKKIDLYVDDKLFVPISENFQVINDHALAVIDGTEDTIFALGACWHGRASRMVQHFHGQLSGLSIEQKEELQRSSDCVRDCHQYLEILDLQKESGMEFVSNSNRSMWMLRTDATESYKQLLKHLVYRNTFPTIGPVGQRTVSIQTRVKCLGESNSYELPVFTRTISIDEPKLPTKIELKSDTKYFVPEKVINQGIYLFRNLSIFTNAIKKNQADISDCTVNTNPKLSPSEQLIVPDMPNLEKILTQTGAMISGIDSIDTYQRILREIAYISKSPLKSTERTFVLTCLSAHDQISTNEIHLRVNIEKQMAPVAPVAAIQSDKLYVDNDQVRDDLFDVDRSTRNISEHVHRVE